MAWNRSSRLSVAAGVLFVTLGTLVGIAQAAPGEPRPPGCNPEGRYICISITDVEDVTHSVADGVSRYTSYSAIVSNKGDSALTNGSATLELKDVEEVDGARIEGDTSTGRVVAVPTGCEAEPADSTTTFTCPLPNLAAGDEAAAIEFFAATSTAEAADFLRLVVTATFKEQARDNPGNAAQPDTFTFHEDTKLEPQPDFSQSVVFFDPLLASGEGSTTLETAPLNVDGADLQTTTFEVPVLTTFSGLPIAFLKEFSSTDPGYTCPVVACFGQTIATSAPTGVFSASNLANLVTTMSSSLLPRGVTVKSLVVHHDDVPFTTACSGDLFTEPDPDEAPCRRVVIDKKAGIVTIDIWDNHQGDWGFS